MTEREDDRGSETDVVLRATGLTKQFGEFAAVEGVDLAVEGGEFHSVIGPNGAGKTTLFDLIGGAMDPTGGSITFLGEDITALGPAERVARGLARSFQLTTVFDGLSVRENVRLATQAASFDGLSRVQQFLGDTGTLAGINRHTESVIGRIGLADLEGKQASTLSYGDRRRLEIGLVLATDPELVLLDEPTAGMGGDETGATIDLIEDVLAEKTLVLVEHDIDLVMDVSDRITALNGGRVVATGTPREISGDESVQSAYLGGYNR